VAVNLRIPLKLEIFKQLTSLKFVIVLYIAINIYVVWL
jgi:hypothetical protein